ncbi:MAG: hypothetical protein MZV64_13045 [Ignavibacteriales bacterium]|nr:hypothetical protein [Ignavibacteriales bacterium]
MWLAGGVAVKPMDKLTLTFDAHYTNWSQAPGDRGHVRGSRLGCRPGRRRRARPQLGQQDPAPVRRRVRPRHVRHPRRLLSRSRPRSGHHAERPGAELHLRQHHRRLRLQERQPQGRSGPGIPHGQGPDRRPLRRQSARALSDEHPRPDVRPELRLVNRSRNAFPGGGREPSPLVFPEPSLLSPRRLTVVRPLCYKPCWPRAAAEPHVDERRYSLPGPVPVPPRQPRLSFPLSDKEGLTMDETTKTPAPADPTWSRRKFLGAASTAAAGLHGRPPPRRRGDPEERREEGAERHSQHRLRRRRRHGRRRTPAAAAPQNIVALCDVDDESVARLLRRDDLEPNEKAMYDKAAKYRDFRRMLEKEKGIDAITVVDPRPQPRRHRHGRHEAGQARLRPEAADPHRSRRPAPLAEARQGRAMSSPRWATRATPARAPAWSANGSGTGAIGDVREVHSLDQPPDLAPGRDRRAQGDPPRRRRRSTGTSGSAPPRAGPTIPPTIPSSGAAWWDFGTGALGDMGAHIMDQPFWALDLEAIR